MLENLVFTGAKIGDHMKIGMQPATPRPGSAQRRPT
jgi:hypothetical protein